MRERMRMGRTSSLSWASLGVLRKFFAASTTLIGAACHGAPIFELGFETASDVESIRLVGAASNAEFARVDSLAHSGTSSLRLIVIDPGGGKQLRPAIDIELPQAIDSSRIKAISCWVHVETELAGHFFGRYDARMLINGSKPLWSIPAIKPGWTHLRWEFANFYEHPSIDKIKLEFGPILPGFEIGTVHVDGFVIEEMDGIDFDDMDALVEIAADKSRSWTDRFQAINILGVESGLDALPALFEAVADGGPEEGYNPKRVDMQTAYIDKAVLGSQAVRSAAMEAIASIALRSSGDERKRLKGLLDAALTDSDGRARLGAINTIREVELGPWTIGALEHALLDEIYYVRDAAMEGLKEKGRSASDATLFLVGVLEGGDDESRKAAARRLSEVGSPARGTLPTLLAVLRDEEIDLTLRQWCLRAVWWIDESELGPEDWGIGLELEPGEIHRHLLNLSMKRLEEAGEKAVAVLTDALTSPEAKVRARAATLLSKAGESGEAALAVALEDPVWYVRAAAGEKVEESGAFDFEPVVVEHSDNTVLLSNGLIDLEFDLDGEDPGPASARLKGRRNMIESDWLYKVLAFRNTPAKSIIERVWFQKIHGVPLDKDLEWELGKINEDHAELIYRYPGSEDYPLEWEIHYVLRRGDQGFYSYMVVRNVTGRELPESTITSGRNSIGMIRRLVAPTWGMFDTAISHDNFKWPVVLTDEPDHGLYPDIYQATFRMPDGGVDAKHEAFNYELSSPVLGYVGVEGGFWQVTPSLESLGGSWPWNQRTSMAHGLFLTALEDKYYIPVGVRITEGWEKLYGPAFYYMNEGGSVEEMWADAKHRAEQELQDWPYPWIEDAGFQDRGEVRGRVRIEGMDSAEGAWALLALPGGHIPEEIEFGQWWRDVGTYHYCVAVGNDGSFDIPAVRSGDYELFVWHEGVFGEYHRKGVTVRKGEVYEAGECLLVPREEGQLLWQIGEPNRSVTEFKNGGNFHHWDNYIRYREDFPEDIEFTVGVSDPVKDWNYLQPAGVRGEPGHTRTAVNFDFDPSTPGTPLLTIVAGGRGANIEVAINGTKVGDLRIKDIGLQHIRSVPYGELVTRRYEIDRSLLREGSNQLVLRFAGRGSLTEEEIQWNYESWTSYVAYDFLRLEMVR